MTKKKNEAIRADLTLEIDEDELGLFHVNLRTEAHDSDQDKEKAFALVQKVAEARQSVPRQQVVAIPGKALREAVNEFLKDGC